MQHIAFIGLGNMGAPMARNLVAAGFHVSVFDLAPAAVASLVEAGATAAASASAAVQTADAVITMLPANKHVQELYLAAGGVLDSAKPGALFIDCSTIAADVARQVAQAASERGFAMIDAPVSGGTAGAAAGTLTFIVGGSEAALQQARPLLEKMGKNIFHAGEAGVPSMTPGHGLYTSRVQLRPELLAMMSDKTFGSRPCACLLYTSPSPRDQRGSRMPSSA